MLLHVATDLLPTCTQRAERAKHRRIHTLPGRNWSCLGKPHRHHATYPEGRNDTPNLGTFQAGPAVSVGCWELALGELAEKHWVT